MAQAYLRDHTAGTGPYKLEQWRPNELMVLVQNETYWRGWSGQHARRIVLRPINDPSTQRLMLAGGSLDVAQSVTIEGAAAMDKDPNITARRDSSFSTFQLFINTQRGPLKDRRVREALAYAFDYDAHITGAMRGTVVRSFAPYPPEMTGGIPGVKPIQRNLDRARQLLREAGYANGFPLQFKFITGRDEDQKAGQILQASLAEIGVKVQINEAPWVTLLSQLQDPATAYDIYPFVILPFVNSPDTFLFPFYHSSMQGRKGRNLTYYSNPAVDQLLDKARVELNPANRRTLYQEAGKTIANDFVAIYVDRSVHLQAFRKRVKGFVYNPLMPFMFNFYELYVE
jgi:peptide/nickel transport system substrate-binding protein